VRVINKLLHISKNRELDNSRMILEDLLEFSKINLKRKRVRKKFMKYPRKYVSFDVYRYFLSISYSLFMKKGG